MEKPFLVFVGLFTATPLAAAPQTEFAWQCNFTQRTTCGPQSCATHPVLPTTGVWIYLTPSQQSYMRCEGEGWDNCDQHNATITDSGEFKNFEIPGAAAFARVGPNLFVTEVVTVRDAVLINRGKCISAPPPMIRTR